MHLTVAYNSFKHSAFKYLKLPLKYYKHTRLGYRMHLEY